MENTIMDKIRSGQSFLYREGGLPSMIIEARMIELFVPAFCKGILG
ncbi:hypothetical protein [Treponema endosymbiont of Eucomonympha sp.]|nr:hypothetical protein [Treponema endosymbiont of Eucomonympha sp.]